MTKLEYFQQYTNGKRECFIGIQILKNAFRYALQNAMTYGMRLIILKLIAQHSSSQTSPIRGALSLLFFVHFAA